MLPVSHGQRCSRNITRIFLLLLVAMLCFYGVLVNPKLSLISSSVDVCYPKSNIVFLKTHKCAGSSIQNIIMRYGDARNLSFVLPNKGNYLGHPTPFNHAMVAWARTPSYNVLAHHARLNLPEIRNLMPENSIYITIVRDPVKVFESSYSYYRLDKFFGRNLKEFIKRLPRMSKQFVRKRSQGKFGPNQMMFDLGASPSIFDKDFLVRSYIKQLDSLFDLVMIADRMDESLVLMRHLLCWDLDDVVTFKINARSPRFKSQLSEVQKSKLKNLNHADSILYNHFLDKFDKSVEAFGRERMTEEIKELEMKTQKWYELCVEKELRVTDPPTKSKYYHNTKVMVFEPNRNASNSTCISMTMEELKFTDLLRQKQILNFPRNYQEITFRSTLHIHERRPYIQNFTS